jgi:hypothetical protein
LVISGGLHNPDHATEPKLLSIIVTASKCLQSGNGRGEGADQHSK